MVNLSKKYLDSILSYDKQSGQLKWKKKKTGRKSKVGCLDNSTGYLYVGIDGKHYYAHRIIWSIVNGDEWDGQIDHINHKREDNRIENLRIVSIAENHKNRTKSVKNTSGATGVYWDKGSKKWRAAIKVDYKKINLGSFANFSEALDARKNAEVLYGFHTNHGG